MGAGYARYGEGGQTTIHAASLLTTHDSRLTTDRRPGGADAACARCRLALARQSSGERPGARLWRALRGGGAGRGEVRHDRGDDRGGFVVGWRGPERALSIIIHSMVPLLENR